MRIPGQHLLRRSVELYIPDGAMQYSHSRLKVTSFLLTATISIFISCQLGEKKFSVDYSEFIKHEITLAGIDKNYEQKDTLGILTINIPSRLDTFYQWHNTSDCLPCGWMQYRFSDKRYAQFKESGFYWKHISGPLYQFTITHNPIKQVSDSITFRKFSVSDTGRFGDYLINDVTLCEDNSFLKKDFMEINGRSYVVTSFISSCSSITSSQSLFVTAQTSLRNRYLNFIGECSIKDTAGFIDNMYKALLSIKVEEKQKN